MPEKDYVAAAKEPITRARIAADLSKLGVRPGITLLVHSSLSSLGWVVGGTQSVVLGLLDALGSEGTVMAPAHTTGNTEPSLWQNPPVPESWWQTIRDHMPAYDPATSPTRMMGAIADAVRTWPGARRSDHPHMSFASVGLHAETLTNTATPLAESVGDASPVGRLYELDGWVLLLGVPHSNNTSLHLAEERANYPKQKEPSGAAVLVDGERRWAKWEQIAYDSDDFDTIGAAFEMAHPEAVRVGTVGQASSRLMQQRVLVDFAVRWMEENRK